MIINIMTLFPEMFSPLNHSMIGRAQENGILQINVIDIRDYTNNKHNRVDDTPYGGGVGMVMQVQPIMDAYRKNKFGGCNIYMSPRGEILDEKIARELSEYDEITILCGHYEGVDQRILDSLDVREISIGDYILTGGELPAMVLIDTISRFIEGVLAGNESAFDESIYSGLLEYPQYSKPSDYSGMKVPDVLLSGNHQEIEFWRWSESVRLTEDRRPDLYNSYIEKVKKGEIVLTKRQKIYLGNRLEKSQNIVK